jgi:hypothetical protein
VTGGNIVDSLKKGTENGTVLKITKVFEPKNPYIVKYIIRSAIAYKGFKHLLHSYLLDIICLYYSKSCMEHDCYSSETFSISVTADKNKWKV